MRLLFQEHVNNRKKPVNIIDNDLHLFEHEFVKKIRSTHLIRVSNGIILNDVIVHIKEGYRKFVPYTHLSKTIGRKMLLKKIFLAINGFSVIKKGVWVIDDWSLAYFHFLTDVLPRLLASQREGEDYPVLLPEHYKNHSYIPESLKLLGVQAYYYSTTKPLVVKNLLIASQTANTGNYNHQLINELREKFLSKIESRGERKIYVSRLKADKRKIINESAIIELVKLYNYEIHYFEDYSFEKQVEIMAQSRNLISIHGAGLTNMLFMRAGGKVLELRNRMDAHSNCYFALASDLDLDYYYQLCDADATDPYYANITVDMVAFKEILAQIE